MANRFLNNITINDAYTLPSTDGTAGQAITTDGSGNLAFSTVDSDSALKITLRVKNVSGGTLNAGTLVRVAPSANPPSGNVLEVDIADNSAASTMPAVGILTASIADDAEGDAVAFGRASGFSTSGYTEGDAIWVGSSGAFVGTKPTGSDLIQKVGQVIKVHASNGSIEVFGAGRTNDVPNLSVGKIWVGTTTNTAESTLVEIDETNNILTVGGKIYYSNVFSQESDLPSATTYHGMFAHVHGTGYAYYAHAGAWVKLAKHSELVAAANDATITLTAGTGLSGGGDFTTDQATNETITVNLDDTAVTPGTYGDADNTPQITIDQQGRVTSATTVATAGAGSGGGSAGELSIERDVFTATADQTAFTISSSITASSNTQVYIDGVYQAKDNYTTSGSVVTFSTGVPLGAEVEVVHFISVLSKVYTDTFTGDGTDTTFDASKDVTDENVTQVYIDGVYQSKDNYTTSGVTITFSTAPPDGSAIEVVHFTSATYSSLNSNQFTGTGSQTDFTLSQEVEEDKSFVFIQGIYQEKSTYSIDGTTLTFTTAPTDGSTIEVITVGSVSVSEANGISWQSSIKTAAFTAVAGQGYFVNTTSAAITVTLPSSPSLGNEVHIVDYAGTAGTNNITITSSDNINGASNDLVISYERGGVSMVYVDSTQGWIAYNAANETATALTPSAYDIDYLLVAGGGSGGSGWGGGGGAGGLLEDTITSISLSETLTISIGGGGAGINTQSIGSNGTNSSISSAAINNITAIGGGGGGSNTGSPYVGQDGGSGGGGSENTNHLIGGSGTSGQGNNGGNGFSGGVTTASGGGGGGAGAAGSNGVSGDGGDGGIGATTTIISTTNATTSSVGEVSGSSLYFAGGGGGGGNGSSTGGLGGGADFSGTGGGTNAANNTGGGGSSSYQYPPYNGNSYTGSGGSGVCILKIHTTNYSGTTTGSPDVYTEGDYKILVFKTNGSYTT